MTISTALRSAANTFRIINSSGSELVFGYGDYFAGVWSIFPMEGRTWQVESITTNWAPCGRKITTAVAVDVGDESVWDMAA